MGTRFAMTPKVCISLLGGRAGAAPRAHLKETGSSLPRTQSAFALAGASHRASRLKSFLWAPSRGLPGKRRPVAPAPASRGKSADLGDQKERYGAVGVTSVGRWLRWERSRADFPMRPGFHAWSPGPHPSPPLEVAPASACLLQNVAGLFFSIPNNNF